jgi:DNA-binding beta-propeller fold protein YncE
LPSKTQSRKVSTVQLKAVQPNPPFCLKEHDRNCVVVEPSAVSGLLPFSIRTPLPLFPSKWHPSAMMTSRVEEFSATGVLLDTWGAAGTAPGQLNNPRAIAVEPGGTVIVGDLAGSQARLQRFTSTGTYLLTFASTGEAQFGCCLPQVAVDHDGRVFCSDWEHNRVVVFAPDGSFGAQWGTLGSGPGQFSGPIGITADADGEVFVFDRDNERVEKFGYVTPTRPTTWGHLKAIYK